MSYGDYYPAYWKGERWLSTFLFTPHLWGHLRQPSTLVIGTHPHIAFGNMQLMRNVVDYMLVNLPLHNLQNPHKVTWFLPTYILHITIQRDSKFMTKWCVSDEYYFMLMQGRRKDQEILPLKSSAVRLKIWNTENVFISLIYFIQLSDMKNSDGVLCLGLFQAWPMSQSKTCIFESENLKNSI